MKTKEPMHHELCDKCNKSLFMIHPDDQFNCMCTPDSTCAPTFVFDEEEEDPVAFHGATQLKSIPVGGSFIFKGERFIKRNNMGWALGVSNIINSKGEVSHLHPNTYINLIH